MKAIKKKNVFVLSVGLLFLLSLLAGLFLAFGQGEERALAADTATESSLRFTLYNNDTEYKVAAADRKLTEAKIPAYYNGLPVTEVADNAFMSCASLANVEIPETVTRVGNNAFYNCRTLQKVVGMINVTEIGNNAFAMCSLLDNLIIPPKVEKLGSSIIRNVTKPVYVRNTKEAIASLNVNWNLNSSAQIIYGNDLVCTAVTEEDGSTSGYSIDPWQVLMPDYDYVLLCSYRYKECNGAECFDTECTNEHTETYYPIVNIDKSAFAGNEFNSLTLIYDDEHIAEHHPINICSEAFMGIFADSINIQVEITLNDETSDFDSYSEWDKGTSTNVFAGSTFTSITLPDTLDKIPRGMFSLCSDLRYIYNTNPYIGANTLSDKIISVNTSAFEYCTSLELLNIPHGVQYIGNAVFDSWGNTETEQKITIDLYKPGDAWDMNWKGELGENAFVQFKTMSVVFERQEGTGGSDGADVTYGEPMPAATAPERVGYTFAGYYSAPNGQGEQYYDGGMASVRNWDKAFAATILYAYWTPNEYEVILADGVVVTAVYGEDMPEAPIPDRETGYIFLGYQGANGTLYYNGDMTSAHVWDVAEDGIQLTPIVQQKEYVVHFSGRTITVMARYGEDMPSADKPGYVPGEVFKGYSYNGTLYYNADMTSAHVWDIDEDNITLVYESEELVTTIFYKMNGGTNASGNVTTLRYSETLVLQEPEKRGDVFDGWYYMNHKVTSLHNLDRERVSVEARWLGYYQFLSGTESSVSLKDHEYYLLELTAKFSSTCTISVAPDVKQVYIYSRNTSKVYDFMMYIQSRTTDFNLMLDDITMIPTKQSNFSLMRGAIDMRTTNNSSLNLYAYGDVVIEGIAGENRSTGQGEEGRNAIYCNTLDIKYSEYLIIRGGRGGQGETSDLGSNGGYAVWAQQNNR